MTDPVRVYIREADDEARLLESIVQLLENNELSKLEQLGLLRSAEHLLLSELFDTGEGDV